MLVSYNLDDSTVDNVSVTDGIKYIYDYASSVGKPCVINLSLGMHLGPHDGTSIFDQLCDQMQGEGKLLVGAVGNEGNDLLHISKTFTPTDNTLQSFLGSYYNNGSYGYCDIWGEENMDFNLQLVIYNKNTGTEIFSSDIINSSVRRNKNYNLDANIHGAAGQIYIYPGINTRNNKPNILINTYLSRINTGNYIGIRITANKGTVHAWINDTYSYFTNNGLEGWTDGDSHYSAGEIGGTGKKIISVGAYCSNEQYYRQTLNNIANFSSKGPTADGRMKPDISAPGTAIISSFSNYAVENRTYTNVIHTNNINGKDYYYGVMQGTSMAAPYVTGVLATWLQAKKTLTPAEAKNIIAQTAINDNYTGNISSTGSNVWGYGKINAWNGIKTCLDLKIVEDNNPDRKLIVYKALTDKELSIIFPEEDNNLDLYISDTSGHIVYRGKKSDSFSNEIFSLDISSLKSGLYILKIKGDKKTYNRQKFIVN